MKGEEVLGGVGGILTENPLCPVSGRASPSVLHASLLSTTGAGWSVCLESPVSGGSSSNTLTSHTETSGHCEFESRTESVVGRHTGTPSMNCRVSESKIQTFTTLSLRLERLDNTPDLLWYTNFCRLSTGPVSFTIYKSRNWTLQRSRRTGRRVNPYDCLPHSTILLF